jgi:hypothetical protein
VFQLDVAVNRFWLLPLYVVSPILQRQPKKKTKKQKKKTRYMARLLTFANKINIKQNRAGLQRNALTGYADDGCRCVA